MKRLLATALFAALSATASAAPLPPKNILFFVAAGAGLNTLTAARIFAVGEDGDLAIDTLPESAFVKTYSRNAQATDGAAAMTAFMTGVKVDNGAIATGPGCKRLATLAELARRRGMATGVVTTTRVTDATPAAVYAHACRRGMEDDIATALLKGGMDVVLGGGAQQFSARTDGRDLLAELRRKGYRIATTGAQLDAPGKGKLLGLFGPADLPFDALRDPAQPGLEAMTASAIRALAGKRKGFFLVVESGLIDVALHDSHARRALEEVALFDRTLKAAIAQMQAIDPGLKNTLIVATGDHDHALLLNGYSRRTGKTTATEPGVLGLVHRDSDGQVRKDSDGAPMTIIGFGTGPRRVQGKRNSVAPLTDEIVSGPDYQQEAVVRTLRAQHAGTDVYLGAIGAGASAFHGTIENTRVFELLRAALPKEAP